jgi:hypothetical protein
VKPDTENIRGLNLVVVKLTTVQVIKLPLYHKIRMIDTICSVKPVQTEVLCVVHATCAKCTAEEKPSIFT